jgi:hypothetical protein
MCGARLGSQLRIGGHWLMRPRLDQMGRGMLAFRLLLLNPGRMQSSPCFWRIPYLDVVVGRE